MQKSQKKKLSKKDKKFFSLVKDASLANPFDEELIKIELMISGLSKNATREERVRKARDVVEKRIKILRNEKKINFNSYENNDAIILKYVFLFSVFSLYRTKFDQFILKQKNTKKSLEVDFADEAIALLMQKGFSNKEALKYFALFYQLRRAFFFMYRELIGTSHLMVELRRNLWDSVFTHNVVLYETYLLNKMQDFSTLILGEQGTGKSLAAKIIGKSAFIPFNAKNKKFKENFTKIFISLNLSQFHCENLEKELFGKNGIFEKCSKYGTVFLDEVEKLPFSVQMKIVKLLQDKSFCILGSTDTVLFQGRIVASAEEVLNVEYNKTVFRDEFLSCISSDIIIIPSLRDRIKKEPKELDNMLIHIISKIGVRDYKELVVIVKETIDKQLGKSYLWLGNIKELEQCVHRVLLKGEYKGRELGIEKNNMQTLCNKIKAETIDAKTILSIYCYTLYKKHMTFEKVSQIVNLDRRTVKKYIEEGTNVSI